MDRPARQQRSFGAVLDAITRSLPFELVIAVDQGEELVTLVHTAKEARACRKGSTCWRRWPAPHAARSSSRCGSQSLGQFVSLLPDGQTPKDWRTFLPAPLEEAEMVDALLWPTNREAIPDSSEIPHEKFGFAFEDGMAEKIVADAVEAAAADRQSPLPVIQAVGALLFDKQVLGKKQDTLAMATSRNSAGSRMR